MRSHYDTAYRYEERVNSGDHPEYGLDLLVFGEEVGDNDKCKAYARSAGMTGGERVESVAIYIFEVSGIRVGTDRILNYKVGDIPRGKAVIVIVRIYREEIFGTACVAGGHRAEALTGPKYLHYLNDDVRHNGDSYEEDREPEEFFEILFGDRLERENGESRHKSREEEHVNDFICDGGVDEVFPEPHIKSDGVTGINDGDATDFYRDFGLFGFTEVLVKEDRTRYRRGEVCRQFREFCKELTVKGIGVVEGFVDFEIEKRGNDRNCYEDSHSYRDFNPASFSDFCHRMPPIK